MENQYQKNSLDDALGASVMSTPEEFKKLEPDSWVDIAVRQCLAAALVDSQKYYMAVVNLEGCLIPRIDEKYWVELEAERVKLKGRIPADEIDFRMAGTKFRLLIALIDRKKPQEAVLEL
jgi:hypothetical protein